MKLGFELTITANGLESCMILNHGTNNKSEDLRSKLSALRNFDSTGKTVIFLKFLGEEGLLIAIVKASEKGAGRGSDNTTAWMHIPAKCGIVTTKSEDNQLYTIVSKLENLLINNTVDESKYHTIFAKEYETTDLLKPILYSVKSKSDQTLAAVYYNDDSTDYSLTDLVSFLLVQKDYNNYSGIFLINKTSDIITSSTVDILKNLQPYSSLEPPTQTLGYGVYLDSRGKKKFDANIERPYGEELTVYFMKDNWTQIPYKIDFKNEPSNSWSNLSEFISRNSKFIIDKKLFKIKNKKCIKDIQIKINNEYEINKNKLEIPEEKLNGKIKYEVSAKGYESKVGYIESIHELEKLMNNNQPIEVELLEKKVEYKFSVPISGGYDKKFHEFKLETTVNQKITKSPIEGFKLKSKPKPSTVVKLKSNHTFSKVFAFGLGVLSTVVLTATCCFLVYISHRLFPKTSNNTEYETTISSNKEDSAAHEQRKSTKAIEKSGTTIGETKESTKLKNDTGTTIGETKESTKLKNDTGTTIGETKESTKLKNDTGTTIGETKESTKLKTGGSKK